MCSSTDWRDIKYNETFETELRGLERRRASDPNCTVDDIEGTLKHLLILEGSDWGGRGDVQDITIAASIAAHELFISNWRSELT
jgi:hypothetical protein